VSAPEPVVLRSRHDAMTGEVLGIEVLEAPALSSISAEMLDQMDEKYRDGDVLTFAPDVRYRIGEPTTPHGDRLLHRLPS
jgi:hypothetical protein